VAAREALADQRRIAICAELDQQREAMQRLAAESESHKSRSEELERKLGEALQLSADSEAAHVRDAFTAIVTACLCTQHYVTHG